MVEGASRRNRAPGGLVTAVEPGSVGEAAGLRPGDRLLAINGRRLRDLIDARFYAAENVLDLLVKRLEQPLSIRIEREYGQPLGLEFAQATFDVDVRSCANNCEFCFAQMNPPGMRRSLCVKDDDYRHSFLFGNFVTLTNLSRDDWARLEEQRLSPLFVSVHATELDLRRRILRRRDAPDILDQFHRLASFGIDVHTQVVLVPGLNDGGHLDRTLADLVALKQHPVLTVGLVPVGLTRYHAGRCRPYTAAESASLLDQVEPWRNQSRKRDCHAFIYPSDEWYLVAGRDMPRAALYDGFPQLENGVGMVRQLLDEWAELEAELAGLGTRFRPATLVCGKLIAPVLEVIVDQWRSLCGAPLRLVSVPNELFGPTVTVSGLLAGGDVVARVRGRDLGEVLLLPRAMFTGRYGAGDAPPGVTLDGMSLADISVQVGARAEMAGSLTEAMAVLSA